MLSPHFCISGSHQQMIRPTGFGQSAMAVDTHVFRVSERIGLTTGSKNPLQTEQTLVRHIPEELIGTAHHWLILHGRYVCKARRPDCLNCGLTSVCRHYQKNSKMPTDTTDTFVASIKGFISKTGLPLPHTDKPMIVALSGGADSVAAIVRYEQLLATSALPRIATTICAEKKATETNSMQEA